MIQNSRKIICKNTPNEDILFIGMFLIKSNWKTTHKNIKLLKGLNKMEKTKELDFKLHTKESAPNESLESLDQVERKFGFIPNLLRQMAGAPSAIQGDLQLLDVFGKSSLSTAEQWIVLLAVSSHCKANYSVAANSTVAQKFGVLPDIVSAVRKNEPLSDPKLESLRLYTLELIQNRGVISKKTQDIFFKAGFKSRQVFDVILGIALATIQSYTSLIAETPIDEMFQKKAITF